MLIPIFIIIISYNIKFSSSDINRIVNIMTILVSGTIVLTNILKISIGAYETKIISYSIFDWFKKGLYINNTFYDVATRGYFSFANMISCLLLGTTSMLFYQLFKKFNFKTVLMIIIQMLAMFMLGTKVSTFGFLLALIAMTFVYLFFVIIKHEIKFNYKPLLLVVVLFASWFLIYNYSPCKNRTEGTNIIEENEGTDKDEKNSKKIDEMKNIIVDENDDLSEEMKKEIITKFVKDNYVDFAIKEDYIINKYPYQYDPYFWFEIMQQPYYKKTDNRFLMSSILDRLKELNNKKVMDDLFGITYSRMSDIGVLERDFQEQFYTLGIFGSILTVGIYLIILIVCGLYLIFNFKKEKFKFKNISLFICLFSALAGAYYCGNTLDNLTFSIIFAFLFGQLVRNLFVNNEKKDLNDDEITILALHLGVGGVEKYISSLCKMLNKQYKIKIISTYKVLDKPTFKFDNVDIQYLIMDKPHVAEMKDAIKNKNIFKFIKFAFKNLNIYILKLVRNIKAVKNIKSKYVITTRIFHNNIVNFELDKNYVKIATEHNSPNDQKYVKKLIDSIKHFDYMVLVSEDLKKFYEDKVKPKCIYIPNVIDSMPDIQSNLKENIIVNIGRLEAEKAQEDLIDVLKIVKEKIDDIKLYIIGDGSLKKKLLKKIRENNLEKNIELTGFLNKEGMEKYLKNAKLFVMTSKSESFGLVLIEAMSYKIPCIAFSQADGPREVLKDGVGILIEDRNKSKMALEIVKLLKNDKLLKEYSIKGYEKSKEYLSCNVQKLWINLLK